MAVEKEVAYRSAADGRDDRDDEEAQHVHAASPGRKHATRREYRCAHQLKKVEQERGLTWRREERCYAADRVSAAGTGPAGTSCLALRSMRRLSPSRV